MGSIWALLISGDRARDVRDWKWAKECYLRAAELDSAKGCLQGGIMLWSGFGGEEDKLQALDLFLKAEKAGLNESVYWCGYAHCCLRRTTADVVRGLNFFEKTEEGKDPVVDGFVEMPGYPTLRSNMSNRTEKDLYVIGNRWKADQDQTRYDEVHERNYTHTYKAGRVFANLLLAAESGYLPAAREFRRIFQFGASTVAPDPQRAA